MWFPIIVSVQFNAVFPALNKSHEACSIENFVSTSRNFRTCCCNASLFSNLIQPLSDSFRGPNKWKSLGARSGLYSRCVRTSQAISAIFCVVWWALWRDMILLKDYTLLKPISCVGIHLVDILMNLRCSPTRQAQFSCSLMHLSSRTLLTLSAVIAVRGTPMWTSSSMTNWRPSQKKQHPTQIHVT